MVRFSRVRLAACLMCHPQVIRSRQWMRHDGGNTLQYQDHREGLRTLPLKAMECEKLRHKNLAKYNLQRANLQGANLQRTNLRGANLQTARLQETKELTRDQLLQARNAMLAFYSPALLIELKLPLDHN